MTDRHDYCHKFSTDNDHSDFNHYYHCRSRLCISPFVPLFINNTQTPCSCPLYSSIIITPTFEDASVGVFFSFLTPMSTSTDICSCCTACTQFNDCIAFTLQNNVCNLVLGRDIPFFANAGNTCPGDEVFADPFWGSNAPAPWGVGKCGVFGGQATPGPLP